MTSLRCADFRLRMWLTGLAVWVTSVLVCDFRVIGVVVYSVHQGGRLSKAEQG